MFGKQFVLVAVINLWTICFLAVSKMTAAYSGMLTGLTIFSSVENNIIVIKGKKKLCTILKKSVKRGLRFIRGSDGEVKLIEVSAQSIDRT